MGASAPSPPRRESRATVLANELIRDIRRRSRAVRNRSRFRPEESRRLYFRTDAYEEARQGAHMADVEACVLRFDRVVQIFAANDLSRGRVESGHLPAWLDDEGIAVPVDPTDAFLESLSVGGGIQYPIQQRMNFASLYRNSSETRDRIKFLPIEKALEEFHRGLVEFLMVRVDESRHEGPGTSGSTPLAQGPSDARAEVSVRPAKASVAQPQKVVFRSLGAAATTSGLTAPPYLPFTVHSRTPGLDIEQAPAYFLSWTFFGGPTTPSDGYILPGLYRFRGQDAQGNIRYDSKKFKVPPLSYASTNL